MKRMTLALLLSVFSAAAFADDLNVITFQKFDSRKVCGLLSSGQFLVEEKKINDFQIYRKRAFTTKNMAFQLTCEQVYDSRMGAIISNDALAIFDISKSTLETEVKLSPITSKIVIANLSDMNEATVLFAGMMRYLNFFTQERVEVTFDNGVAQSEWRLRISCAKKPNTNLAQSCSAVSVLN